MRLSGKDGDGGPFRHRPADVGELREDSVCKPKSQSLLLKWAIEYLDVAKSK